MYHVAGFIPLSIEPAPANPCTIFRKDGTATVCISNDPNNLFEADTQRENTCTCMVRYAAKLIDRAV